MIDTEICPDIFRAYDIRGIVGQGLDAAVVRKIGQAIGSEVIDSGYDTLFVGRDCRSSSPELGMALAEGLCASGCQVINLGEVPTPLLYYAAYRSPHGCGVMLTGSHNPGNYNGIKVVLNKQTLADNQIDRLRQRINKDDLHQGQGSETQLNILDPYIDEVSTSIKLSACFKVCIDCGNGVTGLVAPALFKALGCEVQTLCETPDGTFPNHHPDPTKTENLQMLRDAMSAADFDLGIAFDGDGDRVILLAADGRVIDADHMLMVFAKDILSSNPGAAVVMDVKSSYLLTQLIAEQGGVPVFSKSGHSFVKRQLNESQALLGGEFSAHIFFKHRWYGFDDGLYTATRFLELMAKYAMSAGDLLDSLPVSASTPELFIEVREQDKFALVDTLRSQLTFPNASINYLDGIRADFAKGWGLIRASNTTPNLVLRFEADTAETLAGIQQAFKQQLHTILPELPLPF